jgi:hypothetical protein
MTSSVTGIAETKRAFAQLAALLAPAANEASKRSLEPTLALAKDLAPVDTGALKRSLIIRRVKSSPKTKPVYLVRPNPATTGKDGRRPSRYAAIVELGLGRMKRAEPFLTPAWEATKGAALQIFGRTFGPALEKSAARVAARRARS